MLLLVIETDFHERGNRGQGVLAGSLEKLHHGGVDVPAVGGDFVGAWAGQMTALMAGVARSGADIVGIEQESIIRMKGLVAAAMFAEQELLEELGGMGAVPFRRARIRHRLDQLILWRQGGGAALGLVSDREIRFHQILGEAAGIGE